MTYTKCCCKYPGSRICPFCKSEDGRPELRNYLESRSARGYEISADCVKGLRVIGEFPAIRHAEVSPEPQRRAIGHPDAEKERLRMRLALLQRL